MFRPNPQTPRIPVLILGAALAAGAGHASGADPGSVTADRERPAEIHHPSWGKVEGWVLDGGTRKPVVGARVAVEVDGAFPARGKGTDQTDPAGHFNARAPLGSISSKFDWGRLLTMHPISLLFGPMTLTKQTKLLDVTEVNVRVEAQGYQPFVGRVRATRLDPRGFELTLDDVWLAPSQKTPGAALVSFSPTGLRLEGIDGLSVEPPIAGPGEKARIVLTTHLPVDRDFKYRAYATSTAIRLADAQMELKRDKTTDPADPRKVVFWKEVTLPKTPVDHWTEIGFFLVRNDSMILRQRATTVLLQHVRTPEERAAAEQVLAGYRAEHAADTGGALARYAQARKEHPACAQAHLFYGNLAMRLGRPAEAAEAFGKLVALDSRDYETARPRCAEALLESGHPKEAMDQVAGAETALGKNRVPAPVCLVRARIYAAQGNFAEADRWLAKAGGNAQLPETALLDINLKRAEAAVKASPENADIRLSYAHVLASAGRREESVAQIRKAVSLEPAQPWAFLDLGSALWDLGRREDGVANLEHAVKLAPENAEALLALGGAYRDLGRCQDALPLYRKVTQAQKLNLAARHNYALMLYAAGQTREARQEWVEVIHQARDKGELRESGIPEAGVYIGPKRRAVAGFSVPEAAADLELLEAVQELDAHPDTGLLWQNIGSALVDLNLPDLALAALEKSRRLDGALPETRFLIAVACRKLGQTDRALKEFEAVVAENPLHPKARLELAQLYTDRGELERAQAQLALHTRTYPRTREVKASRSLGG